MDKSPAEKRRYVGSVVRGHDTSTTVPTDLAEEGAATDSPITEEKPPTKQPTRRRTTRDPGWWERNRADVKRLGWQVVGSLLATGLIALVGLLVYDLNRDVAKLQQRAEDTKTRLDDVQNNVTRVEDRLQGELIRLRERLDDLRERFLGSRRPK